MPTAYTTELRRAGELKAGDVIRFLDGAERWIPVGADRNPDSLDHRRWLPDWLDKTRTYYVHTYGWRSVLDVDATYYSDVKDTEYRSFLPHVYTLLRVATDQDPNKVVGHRWIALRNYDLVEAQVLL